MNITLTFAAQDGGRAVDQLPDLLKSSVSLLLHHRRRLQTQTDVSRAADRNSIALHVCFISHLFVGSSHSVSLVLTDHQLLKKAHWSLFSWENHNGHNLLIWRLHLHKYRESNCCHYTVCYILGCVIIYCCSYSDS